MGRSIWIKNPLACLAENAGGGFVIRDGLISELLPGGRTPDLEDGTDWTLFDASRHVVLPGLINSHHHFYQTLTRACRPALNKPLFPWLQSLYPIWAHLDQEMMATASELALAECLLSGCTTASDHHYLFPQALTDAIDIQIEVAGKIGMRVHLTRGSMSLGQDQGGLPPQSTVQEEDDILADSERLIQRFHDPTDGAMIRIALAPCSPFSVSTDLMTESAALARRHEVRLHTHLAETHDETEFCQRMFGLRPLDYLEKVGWLADDVWLAHGIHFNEEEIKRLGTAGVGIAHCPSSNMILSSGIAPTLDLERAGCPVGLGVDGSASNDGSNLIQEVRQALLIGRLRYDADEVTHQAAYRWATEGSAGCLGRTDIGKIEVGRQADLALYNLDEPRFSGSGDPLAALLLCGAHRADYVMIGGKWKVEKEQICGLDLEALMHRHHQLGSKLQASVA